MKLNLFVVPYYTAKGGVLELGGEFFPISTKAFLISYPVILPMIFVILGLGMLKPMRIRFETKALFLCALPLFVGSFTSQRYLIHEYPLFLLWAAAHTSDLLEDGHELPFSRILGALKLSWTRLVMLGSAVVMVLFIYPRMQGLAQKEGNVNAHYERMGKWLRENVPPGQTIFHANWSDSQFFICMNPKNDYFVTLDPIFMYDWNPDLYNLYRQISYGNCPDTYGALKHVFKVQYGYAGKYYFGNLINKIARDRRFKIVVTDPQGIIFKLDP